MLQDKRERLRRWLESGEARLQPLAFPQRELWEATPVPVASPANHICAFIELRGAMTPADCTAAIQRVVNRQEVLRLSFLPGKEQPVQMIRATGSAVVRFRELPAGQRHPEAIEDTMREIFSEPFDLLQGPLYRVEILQRAANDLVLAFAIHHAIADGWTLGVFVQDLVAAYLLGLRGGGGALPPVPLSYNAWAAAERAFWQPSELESRAGFWKSCLTGSRRFCNSPGDVTGSPLQRWVTMLPADLAQMARELARRTGATLFSTLLTAFQLTLAEFSGEDDIIVGTPVANRSRKGARETMGYCSGIVPLRGVVDRGRPFASSVRVVHQNVVDSFAHAMPFAELVRILDVDGPRSRHPVFDVRFALQNHPIPEVSLPGLSARLTMRSTGTARFDLGCEITEEGDALEVVWLFRPELFSRTEIETLQRLFAATLAAVRAPLPGRPAALTT